jgi:hypothetical protein
MFLEFEDEDNEYYLVDNHKVTIASTDPILLKEDGSIQKLSKENCDEIFGVVYVEKLAEENYPSGHDWTVEESLIRKLAFKNGFNKGMELNKDKLFTIEDMYEAIRKAKSYDKIPNHDGVIISFNYSKEEIIQSLQPKEIKVEIEMEKYGYCEGCIKAGMLHCAHADTCGYAETRERQKLDDNGCLILIRKN